jgi:hypothetical protein
MHAVILDLFVLGGHRMTMGRTAIYLPIVLGVSSLTYLAIEQPFNRRVQRWVRFGNAPSERPAPGGAPGWIRGFYLRLDTTTLGGARLHHGPGRSRPSSLALAPIDQHLTVRRGHAHQRAS